MPIQVVDENDSLLVRWDEAHLKQADAKNCAEAVFRQNKQDTMVIFDFSRVRQADDDALAVLENLLKYLENANSRLMILAHRDLARVLEEKQDSDLSACFVQVGDAGASDEGSREKKIPGEEELFAALGLAVQHTLETYASVKAQSGTYHSSQAKKPPANDVGSMVAVMSDRFRGTVAMGFPLKTYLGIMSKFHGKNYTDLEPEIWDWAAELMNVTLGLVKRTFSDQGGLISYPIPKAVPAAVMDSLRAKCSTGSIIIPFQCEFGEFFVEYCRD